MPTNKQVICRTTGLLDDDRVVQLISVKLVADSHAVMSLHFARNQTNSNNKTLKICAMTIRMRAIRSVAVGQSFGSSCLPAGMDGEIRSSSH